MFILNKNFFQVRYRAKSYLRLSQERKQRIKKKQILTRQQEEQLQKATKEMRES